jgi:hypothetical protein
MALGPGAAAAQPKPEPESASAPAPAPAPAPAEPVHTHESVADAPEPDRASGVARGPDRSGEWALWIPRVLLFPIRVVAEVVNYPVRRLVYTYEAYNLGPRVRSIFFNQEDTVGLFPVALVETGFGLNAGARLILRELGGTDFGLSGRASFGGRFRQLYSLRLSSGDTWRGVSFDLRLEGEARPKDQFWGIGDGDEAAEPPMTPQDPFAGALFQSRFRQRVLRAVAGGEVALGGPLRTRLSAALTDRDFAPTDLAEEGERIEENFDVDQLVGFERGIRHLYLEAELRLDTRRAPDYFEGASMPTAGFLIAAFAGVAVGAGRGSQTYGRYGADVQRFFRLGVGPRVLALRLFVEGVTGDYDEVPFYDLPVLGGEILLRGYEAHRFRDRVSAVGGVEYQWDLSTRYLAGFLFADAGRVFPDLDSVGLEDLRLGFGGGFEAHFRSTFYGRLTLASSKDGGFFATLSLDPVFDVKARVDRK